MTPRETAGLQQRSFVLNELQLLLAEKRTALATMRTGITIFALPLSVVTFLIATSSFYNVFSVLPVLLPLAAVSGGLVLFGLHLIYSAFRTQRWIDRKMDGLRRSDRVVNSLVEGAVGPSLFGFLFHR
jgi:uncharacterized membrane protein YidH (DUF202 family)